MLFFFSQLFYFELTLIICIFALSFPCEHHVFNYADMVKNSITPVEVVTSMNHTTKFAYNIKEKGLYVFFNKSTKKAVLIEVE